MLMPNLVSWVKQLNYLLCLRVTRTNGCRFAQVAACTGKAEILGIVIAIRLDMFNMHRLAGVILTGLAVFTTAIGTFIDQPLYRRPGWISHLSPSIGVLLCSLV